MLEPASDPIHAVKSFLQGRERLRQEAVPTELGALLRELAGRLARVRSLGVSVGVSELLEDFLEA